MEKEKARLRKSIYYPIGASMFLWFVKALEWALSMDFGTLGILPRTLKGTGGILLSGFIHGDVFHLMSNTVPLVMLGGAIIYFYDQKGFLIILLLYLLTGSMVWVFARTAYHIGASGLVYGMLSFLFFSGLIRKNRKTLVISCVVLILYGGSMFNGLVPTDDLGVSWESHLIGFGLGVLAAIYYRRVPLASFTDFKRVKDDKETAYFQPPNIIEGNYTPTLNTNDRNGQPVIFRYYYREKDNPKE